MITVNWQHLILDIGSYARAGSHRFARVRQILGSTAFHVERSGTWTSPPGSTTWSPIDDARGRPEPAYAFDGNNYLFGFWSVVARRLTPSGTGVTFSAVYPGPASAAPSCSFEDGANVDATAYYFWDFGVGPGDHGAYIDAFDVTNGAFISDDFVDVFPDADGSLTAAANDGLLLTGPIDTEVITARDPAGDSAERQYGFQDWQVIAGLSLPGGNHPAPTVNGREIKVHTNNIISAVAFYSRQQGAGISLPVLPRESFLLIGNLADGGFVIFGPRGRVPIGPWDPMTIEQTIDALKKWGGLT